MEQVVLERTIASEVRGEVVDLSLEEALQQITVEKAFAGDPKALREALKWIRKREDYIAKQTQPLVKRNIVFRIEKVDPQNANEAMRLLGITAIHEETSNWEKGFTRHIIENWAVQAALDRRRGGNKLTEQEITAIQCCAREVSSLTWPRGTKI